MLEKRVLIAVPTYNRSEIVEYYLKCLSDYINSTPNLYLGFYDSSSDETTKNIVKEYIGDKIKYKRYEEGLSEEKGLDILDSEGEDYDYIWFCSDRKVLKLSRLIPLIERDINNGVDLVFFSNFNIKEIKKYISDQYEMGIRFFEVLNMAKTVIGKSMFHHMKEVYMKYYGSHFSIQAAMMDYVGSHSFTAVQYNLRDQDVAITGAIEFSHEWGDNVVWQWSKSWCDTVDKLPSSFDAYKEEIIRGNYMFQLKKVLARRATGNEYYFSDIKEFWIYINRITDTVIPLFLAKSVPRILLKYPYKAYKMIKTKMAEN